MFNSSNRNKKTQNNRGQNAIEYMLVMLGVVVVLVVAAGPGGILKKTVKGSLDKAFDKLDEVVETECLGAPLDGKWSEWGDWTECSGCSKFKSRSCIYPNPLCKGAPCEVDAEGYDIQTKSCDSGGWVPTAFFGECKRSACGLSDGERTSISLCPSGCCTGPAPTYTESCTTADPYGDWEYSLWGQCSVICGKGTEVQAASCMDPQNCCEGTQPPPITQDCYRGCCGENLMIGFYYDENGDKTEDEIEGYFPEVVTNGPVQSRTACPPRHSGNPTRNCNSPDWGGLLNACGPSPCEEVTEDLIADSEDQLDGTFHRSENKDTVPLDCHDADIFGYGYEGTSSNTCIMGEWQDFVAGCQLQKCGKGTFRMGDIDVTFPVEKYGTLKELDCDKDVDSRFKGTVKGDCLDDLNDGDYNFAKWMNLSGGCTAKNCSESGEYDIGQGLRAKFPATDHGQRGEIVCNNISSYYTGTAYLEYCQYGSWNGAKLTQGCLKFMCNNPFPVGEATKCSDEGVADDQQLTADTDWVLKENGAAGGSGCTPAKCEYVCNDGYVIGNNGCVKAQCLNVPSSHAEVFGNSNQGLTRHVQSTACKEGECSGSIQCEYECDFGYVVSGNDCVLGNPCRNGEVESGQQRLYFTAPASCGQPCASELRTCNNGKLSGSYEHAVCPENPCNSCKMTFEDGIVMVDHNSTTPYYTTPSAPCEGSCPEAVMGQWTCNDGDSTSVPGYKSCVQACCPVNGTYDGQSWIKDTPTEWHRDCSITPSCGGTCSGHSVRKTFTAPCKDGFRYIEHCDDSRARVFCQSADVNFVEQDGWTDNNDGDYSGIEGGQFCRLTYPSSFSSIAVYIIGTCNMSLADVKSYYPQCRVTQGSSSRRRRDGFICARGSGHATDVFTVACNQICDDSSNCDDFVQRPCNSITCVR